MLIKYIYVMLLATLLLSTTACNANNSTTTQDISSAASSSLPNIADQQSSDCENVDDDILDAPSYQLLSFEPDPLISTAEELKDKRLLSLDELYDLAQELNQNGNFGYVITKEPELPESLNYQSDKTVAISVVDPKHDLSATVVFYETYCFCKSISFEATPTQIAETDKMIWFARHLFGNLPNEAFDDFKPDSHSNKYLYVNGDIMYRYYLSAYSLTAYDTKKTAVNYYLSHCYNSIEQYKEFFSDAVPLDIAEFPDYFLSKRLLRINAQAKDIKLHESSEYYEAMLYDKDGNSVPCRIDNIRTADTVGDINTATVFIGGLAGDYFNASFYY